MKIERTLRPTPLTRSIERIVREDDGRAETEGEAVTLDLNEQRREKQESPYSKGEPDNSRPDEREATSKDEAEKAPLNVVA